MKRRQLEQHMKRHGCELGREGSRHSIWRNSTTRDTSAVPRHSEIANRLAHKICKDLGIPSP